MAASLLAVSPVNTPGGYILSFVFLMVLFIVIAAILWALFAGWDWRLSRRFRPAWVHHFQTAIAEDVQETAPVTPPAGSTGPPAETGASGEATGAISAAEAPSGAQASSGGQEAGAAADAAAPAPEAATGPADADPASDHAQ